jgi:hypothetical protein
MMPRRIFYFLLKIKLEIALNYVPSSKWQYQLLFYLLMRTRTADTILKQVVAPKKAAAPKTKAAPKKK